MQVPLSVDGQRRCAAGAPGLALWVPHPLRALTILRNSSGALLAHWESHLPADPLVGLAYVPGRGTLRRAGGTMGGVGGSWAPLGGLLVLVWGVGWGALVVPFPLTAGLPLVASCCANSPEGSEQTVDRRPEAAPAPLPPGQGNYPANGHPRAQGRWCRRRFM